MGTFWGDGIFANQGSVCEWTSSRYVITYGGWYHIAITIKAGEHAEVYVNGDPLSAITWCIPTTLKDIPFFGIGARLRGSGSNSERFFNGAIDEFAIFNRVLTAAEIQAHYQDGLNGVGYEGVQIAAYICTGFKSPMHLGTVKVKKNRVLPIKTELFDSNGQEITSLEIGAIPPVIQVLYYGSTSTEPVDVTDLALAAGQGTDGNQFEFTADGLWQFNLKTSNYAAKGTY
ncbi:MAG: LamG domain-containing protein, partial [Bryobacterales bacterium]|nr:LamG domain-containing protein [Bryobacterales bacterium]